MKGLFYIFIIAVLLAGCSPCKHLSTTQEQDSTLTKVITQTYYVKDTVRIEIPAQTAERTTADSVSELENDYATSKARINPDGTLYHDLKTKPQDIPKEVETPVHVKDSIVYRYKYKDKVQTVEVERELTWWQKTQIYGFWLLSVLIIARLIWKYRSKIMSFIRKLI